MTEVVKGTTKKWFTSDLHHSHKRIVEFTNRGVDTTQEQHDEWLVDLWNSQVAPGDLVYHIGDFSFAKSYDSIANFVEKLNGQKILIKGNHDRSKNMLQLLWDGLVVKYEKYLEIDIGKTNVTLFHFPIAVWHKQHYGAWHLHGHSHGNYRVEQGKILDVGLDNAYNVYGKHVFFDESMIQAYMDTRSMQVLDHHTERKGEM